MDLHELYSAINAYIVYSSHIESDDICACGLEQEWDHWFVQLNFISDGTFHETMYVKDIVYIVYAPKTPMYLLEQKLPHRGSTVTKVSSPQWTVRQCWFRFKLRPRWLIFKGCHKTPVSLTQHFRWRIQWATCYLSHCLSSETVHLPYICVSSPQGRSKDFCFVFSILLMW